MISTILNTTCVLATCLIFALLCRADTKSNLPHEERHRQFLMPVFAIVYSIVLLCFFQNIYGWMESLYRLLTMALPFFKALNLSCFAVCIFNLLAMLAFVIGKRIALSIVNHTSEGGRDTMLRLFYNIAYYYDEEESKWLLRIRYSEIRSMVKWMHLAAIVVALLLLVLSLKFSASDFFANPFYPVFLALILGEVRYFFDGMSKDEYLSMFSVESDDFEHVRDYLALQKSAAQNFPHRFIESHVHASPRSSTVSSREYIDGLIESDDYEERLAGTYVNAVYHAMKDWFSASAEKHDLQLFEEADFEETFRIKVDQIQTMVKLLKGENVIFATPFYKDFREFFFFPVNRTLMQGGKVLVIDGQGDMTESVAEWVKTGLHTASSVPNLWKIEDLHRAIDTENLDVGILPFYHLNDLEFLHDAHGFFEKVGFVILLHPSNMIAVTQIGFSMLTQAMPDPQRITYAAFDVNADGLVDSLSHATHDQFVEVNAMQDVSFINCGIHWRTEGTEEYRDVLENVSHYLGVGTQIAAHTLSLGAEKVRWSAHRDVPLKDIRWLFGQYYPAITRYAAIGRSQDALERAIEIDCNMWNAPVEMNGYHIAEDEICNLLEVQRQYSTRGVNSTFVHVMSGNYLLRDFMRYNTRILLNDSRALSLTVADYERSLRNYLIELLSRLLHEGRVDAEDVRSRLHLLGISIEPADIYEYLGDMLDHYALLAKDYCNRFFVMVTDEVEDIVLGKDIAKEYIAIREEIWREKSRALAGELDETLTPDSSLELFRELLDNTRYLRYSHYISEDEVEEDRQLGSCLFGQVQQRYLPGQFLTLGGKYYEVISVTDDSGMLLRRAGDHFDRRLQYRQVKRARIANCNDSERAEAERSRRMGKGWVALSEAPRRRRVITQGDAEVEIAILAADIEVSTDGYLRMVDYADLANSSFVTVDADMIIPRNYTQKNVLRLTFKGASDRQLITLATLINELARTVYACDHEYLMAAPALASPVKDFSSLGLRGAVFPLEVDDTAVSPAIYIIEDSTIDIGLVSSFERNAERFLAVIEKYLAWHSSMLKNGPLLDPDAEHFVSPEQVLADPDVFEGDKRLGRLLPRSAADLNGEEEDDALVIKYDPFEGWRTSRIPISDEPEFEFDADGVDETESPQTGASEDSREQETSSGE